MPIRRLVRNKGRRGSGHPRQQSRAVNIEKRCSGAQVNGTQREVATDEHDGGPAAQRRGPTEVNVYRRRTCWLISVLGSLVCAGPESVKQTKGPGATRLPRRADRQPKPKAVILRITCAHVEELHVWKENATTGRKYTTEAERAEVAKDSCRRARVGRASRVQGWARDRRAGPRKEGQLRPKKEKERDRPLHQLR